MDEQRLLSDATEAAHRLCVREVLFDVNDVAQVLRTSPWTVRRWEADGKLKAIRLGKLVRFERSEVQRFIAQGRKIAKDSSK